MAPHGPNCEICGGACAWEDTNMAKDDECCTDCRWLDHGCRGDCPCHQEQPEQCYICHGYIEAGEETKTITVDDDPGDAEVGPQPDICEVTVHVNCPVKNCEHEYKLDKRCGAMVCLGCEDHKGLVRCFCGWARDGGDGRRQLEEMGERIDED